MLMQFHNSTEAGQEQQLSSNLCLLSFFFVFMLAESVLFFRHYGIAVLFGISINFLFSLAWRHSVYWLYTCHTQWQTNSKSKNFWITYTIMLLQSNSTNMLFTSEYCKLFAKLHLHSYILPCLCTFWHAIPTYLFIFNNGYFSLVNYDIHVKHM